MNIKGRAEITLFDAETGVVTDHVESDNLVTNFFDVIFNESLQRLVCVNNENKTLLANMFSFTRLVEDLMAGVLVFSESVEESVDNVYPSPELRRSMIGCGNQGPTVVGSSFRGTLNAAETVITDSYATFTWDFGTAQCNGEIASICLTSNRGGAIGCRFDAKGSNDCKSSMLSIAGANLWGPITVAPVGIRANVVAPLYRYSGLASSTALFVETDDAIYERRLSSRWVAEKKPAGYAGLVINDTLKAIVSAGSTSSADAIKGTISKSLSKGVAYSVEHVSADSSVNVYKYTGDMTTPVMFTVPYTNLKTSIDAYLGAASSVTNMVNALYYLYKDKFILIFGALNDSTAALNGRLRCYVVNADGSFISEETSYSEAIMSNLLGANALKAVTMDTSISGLGSLCTIDDELYLLLGADNFGYAAFYINVDTAEVDTMPSYNFVDILNKDSKLYESGNGGLKKPFYCTHELGVCSSSTLTQENIAIMPDYLATINNIDAVLTKDPTKTMKIVYTLTQSD